jgi:hypothetical protein
MALARYTDTFWYPSGQIATNVPARIFPLTSSALASLWTDVTGTVALDNPLLTSGTGVLDFWAEEGEYWIHIDTEAFRVSVGSPNLDVFEVSSATISTGVVSGGLMTVNGTNPLAVDISPMVGYIVDTLTDPVRPTAQRISLPAQTVALDAAALLRTVTWWSVNSAGTVVQSATPPTNTTFRTSIFLGNTGQAFGTIFIIKSRPVILQQPANQFVDLMEGLGPFRLSGVDITANGANLFLNQSAGELFSRAFDHYDAATQTNDPHVASLVAQTPAVWRYSLRNTTDFSIISNAIDPANFDSGGVLTPVGGGANTSTIQRVYAFAAETSTEQMAIQYGQITFSSLSAAVDAIGAGNFVQNPNFGNTVALIAYIAVTRTATDLSNPAQAIIIRAGKFATP